MVSGDIVCLQHVRDAIVTIERYASVGHASFRSMTIWQDAIIRQLETVCQATKRLSSELRDRHPEFASGRLRELQDELDHNFLNVDLRLVWDVTQQSLPGVKRTVEALLDEQSREKGQA